MASGKVNEIRDVYKGKPATVKMGTLPDSGRAGIYTIKVSENTYGLIYLMYGQTIWDGCDAAATDALDIILGDVLEWDDCPVFIAGDFNASISRVAAAEDVTSKGIFYDIGAIASKYRSEDGLSTCLAYERAKYTRRDYVLANE